MTESDAIRVVARRVVEDATANRYGEMWEMYPDIGENDWERVCERVQEIIDHVLHVEPENFDAAYAVLSERAG